MGKARHRINPPLLRTALAVLLAISSLSYGAPQAAILFENDAIRIGIDGSGRVVTIELPPDGASILREPVPLIHLVKGSDALDPERAERSGDGLDLYFPGGTRLGVSVRTLPSHIAFEIASLTDADSVDVAVWGPYRVTLGATIGETVGVVQENGRAVGIQALNPKTLGGLPVHDNDTQPNEQVELAEPTPWGDTQVTYHSEAARPDEGGASLQAYVRDRSRARVIANRNYEHFLVPPFDDGGIVGSAVALFGATSENALETIGRIELAEGLPHPLLDGRWAKTARAASASYIVSEFGEDSFDYYLDVTERAGLHFLYHDEPFSSWGAFTLDPAFFPQGKASLKTMVERAEARGIHLGIHTLANYVTPNDPLVRPVPDPGLATVGTAKLTRPIGPRDRDLRIDDPTFLSFARKSHLGGARIGDEMIRYESVSESEPWRLLGVQRGAFGTSALPHDAGATIDKIDDHVYGTFLAGMDLSLRMARTLASLMNETGVRQIGFDGHGGVHASGMGKYAEALFALAWYEALDDNIRSLAFNSSSNASHFYWHIYTRMNWGEPWNQALRNSQLVRRLRSQDYYRRNLMVPMLGWFMIKPETSIADIEWMLARAAGFDAGFALVARRQLLEANGESDEMLDRVRIWEEARLAGAFPTELREALQDTGREFVLEESGPGAWNLFPIVVKEVEAPDTGSIEYEVADGERLESILIEAGPRGLGPAAVRLDGDEIAGGIRLAPSHVARIDADGFLRVLTPTWQRLDETRISLDGFNRPGPKVLELAGARAATGAPARVLVRYRARPIALTARAARK